MRVRVLLIAVSLSLAADSVCACAQAVTTTSPNTVATTPFTFARFRDIVAANHPTAHQARLVAAQARSAMQEAWGGFDPKFTLSTAQKAFKGQPYYNYLDAAIKVPTPFGSDIKLGFERATGPRVSTDRATASTGLLSLGLSLPLGQRLITDERRTAVVQARALRDVAIAEEQGMINKLLLDAAKVYGNWYAASRRFEIANEGVRLAAFRFDAVVLRVRNGDSAPIDTIEAALEVQRRAVIRAEAELELRAASLLASTYLWDARGNPVDLEATARPVLDALDATPPDTMRLATWLAAVSTQHPDLRKAEGKLRVANADRLLALQGILPFAEATVVSLGGRDDASKLASRDQWEGNYKAGLEVQSSLLLLKERGKATRSAQKAEFARWDRDEIRRELAYSVRVALYDVVLLEQLLTLQRVNVRSTTLLRDAEQQRFDNGESTLLLVNIRERALLDESAKLASLEGKIASARAGLVVALGDPALLAEK